MSLQNEFAPYITDGELKVALLVFAGNTSKDIAAILALAKCTVESHRKSIRTRFHVRNFLELRRKYPSIAKMKPGRGRQYPPREE